MKKNRKAWVGVIALLTVIVTLTSTVFAKMQLFKSLSENPWDYTVLTFGESGNVKITSQDLIISGDVRSNGSVNFNGTNLSISGCVGANGDINHTVDDFFVGEKYENAEHIKVPDVWENVHNKAIINGAETYIVDDITDNFLKFDSSIVAEDCLNVTVSSTIEPTQKLNLKGQGKIGAFGAGFLAKAYDNRSKWNTIFPMLYNNEDFSSNSLLELGNHSNIIPIQEQSTSTGWEDYEKLPGAAITNHFNKANGTNFIEQLKQGNAVFSIDSSDAVTIQGQWDSSTINPIETLNAEKIVVKGGNIAFHENFENLKEIKFDNGGGAQLIGNFPNLKYIYKTSWSDLNLAGNFPALECIYMPGGQLLLGTGTQGFYADNLTVINENGSIGIYTAKDITITNSRFATAQSIAIRGIRKDVLPSKFNVENTVMVANNGLMFEDMNDRNLSRYEKIPVFYSNVPISFVNCNFELMQGLFMTSSKSIIMAASNINTFRGFLFAPDGINEYQSNSALSLYLNTYAYNISPEIHHLNVQPDGSEKIGRISAVEYADFPHKLLSDIGDEETFLNELEIQSAFSDEYNWG